MASRGGKRPGAGRPKKTVTPPDAQSHTDAEAQPVPPQVAETVPVENLFGLSPQELLFLEAYCGTANFVAVRAYELAGYSMRGRGKARYSNAAKVLERPKVQTALAAKLAARVAQLRVMSGEEALERMTVYARGDIGLILGPDDSLSKLPADVRQTIKAVRPTRYGRVIELYDAMKATELMAKAGGKLKDHVEHSGKVTLEDIVAGDAPQNGAAA